MYNFRVECAVGAPNFRKWKKVEEIFIHPSKRIQGLSSGTFSHFMSSSFSSSTIGSVTIGAVIANEGEQKNVNTVPRRLITPRIRDKMLSTAAALAFVA